MLMRDELLPPPHCARHTEQLTEDPFEEDDPILLEEDVDEDDPLPEETDEAESDELLPEDADPEESDPALDTDSHPHMGRRQSTLWAVCCLHSSEDALGS